MKKIASILILSLLFPSLCLAQEDSYDYYEVHQGESAPFDGFLFTYDGLANALAKVEGKHKRVLLEKDGELQRVKNNLEGIIKGKDSELLSKSTMYESQLRAKQNTINALQTDAYWSNIKLVGAVVVGVTAGIITGVIVTKLSN